jgi:hypothetical protein
MPIRGSKREVCSQEINSVDPLPRVAGENSSRESSIQNGNSTSGQTPSEVPAKRSGGPRTKRGKNRSSRNATRHGVFAAVVLPEESPKMYRDILHAFCDYIKPNDRAEEILVDKLAANIWRSKRLILAESAEVYYTSGLAWSRGDATEIPRHYRNVDSAVWGQPSFLMLPTIQIWIHA